MTILLTRPKGDSERVAAMLQKRGVVSVISPVISIEQPSNAASAIQQAIAILKPQSFCITSRHALAAAKAIPALKDMRLYVVGDAKNFEGFNVKEAVENVEALVRIIPQTASPMLYLCGKHVQHELAELLAPHKIEVAKVVVYEGVAATALGEQAQAALDDEKIKAVALYSTRSAEIFFELVSKNACDLDLVAISQPVADAARLAGHCGKTYIAKSPDGDAMIEQICLWQTERSKV